MYNISGDNSHPNVIETRWIQKTLGFPSPLRDESRRHQAFLLLFEMNPEDIRLSSSSSRWIQKTSGFPPPLTSRQSPDFIHIFQRHLQTIHHTVQEKNNFTNFLLQNLLFVIEDVKRILDEKQTDKGKGKLIYDYFCTDLLCIQSGL